MDLKQDIGKIKELLGTASDILIVTHSNPTIDSIGSSLALSLGLISLGKKVTVVCPDAMTVAFSSFVGVQKIVRTIGNKNFVISLDYTEGSIEKVSYNIEGDKFNLVIEPRGGYDGFSEDKVHYTRAGNAADMICAIGMSHLGELDGLEEANKELFATKPIINIDTHAENSLYGAVNLVDPEASSVAELVSHVLSNLGAQLTEDIATNVLNALYGATDSFQSSKVTAQAFELAAACVKMGGKKFTNHKDSEEIPLAESVEDKFPFGEPAREPAEEFSSLAQEDTDRPTPPDWLKPKIFKSSQGQQGPHDQGGPHLI